MRDHDLLFASREERDRHYDALLALGSKTAKRYSIGPALLHPMYVEDKKDTPEGLDRGFGNTVYKTFWARLYGLKWGIENIPFRGTDAEAIADRLA